MKKTNLARLLSCSTAMAVCVGVYGSCSNSDGGTTSETQGGAPAMDSMGGGASGGNDSGSGGNGSGGALGSGGTSGSGGTNLGGFGGVPATCDDEEVNGGESHVDCGGPCPDCENGESCNLAADCQSGHCPAGTCAEPPVWQASTLLDSGKETHDASAFALSNSEAMAVWYNAGVVHASRYTGGAWTSKQDIDMPDAVRSVGPLVGGYGTNKYVAVWGLNGSFPLSVHAATFNGVSWTSAFDLDGTNSHRALDKADFHPAGFGAILYHGANSEPYDLYLRRFNAGAFGAVEDIGLGKRNENDVAVNGVGDVVVTWIEPGDTTETLWLVFYDANDGWLDPVEVATTSESFTEAVVDIDDDGNVFLLGRETFSSAVHDLWAWQFVPGAGLDGGTRLANGVYLLHAQAAWGSDGSALAAWWQSGASAHVRHRAADGTWGSTQPMPGAGQELNIRIAPYERGAFGVVYGTSTGAAMDYDVDYKTGRYISGQGFIEGGLIEDTDLGDDVAASLHLLPNGQGVAAWRRRLDYGTTTPDLEIRVSWLR